MKPFVIFFVLFLSACGSKKKLPEQTGISAEELLWLADKGTIADFENIANTSGLRIIDNSYRLDGVLQYMATKDNSDTTDELQITLTNKMKISLVTYSTIDKDIVVGLRKEFIKKGFKVKDTDGYIEELARHGDKIGIMIMQVDSEENYYKIFLGNEKNK